MTPTTTFASHQYQLVTTAKTWGDAKQYAEQLGGHLASIESLAENDVLRDFLLPLSTDFPTVADGGGARYVWLGGNDIASEGAWKWSNNTSVSGFTHWGSGALGGEPDNYLGKQDGMAMGLTVWPYPSGGLGQAGQWNDINENNKIYFLVEWDGLQPAAGTTGNDTFNGGTGISIDGKEGIDSVLYASKLVNPTKTASGWTLGADTLTNVERLKFSDTNLALDIDGNAGKVAKILAVTFGSASVFNKQYVSTALDLIDQGMSYEALAKLAINAAGARTSEAIVDLLWFNLTGNHPTTAQAKPFIDLLATPFSSVGALGVLAAENAVTIGVLDLNLLSQTGLEYI